MSGTKEGAAEWLSCELAPWSNGGQKEVTVRYYLDITDAENARIKIDRLIQSLRGQVATDHTSGLLNRTAALNKLETQVSRSRRYHNLLSLVLIQMTGPEEALSKPAVMAVSQLLRDQTRWPDIIGRWQESEFLLILPETSAGSAAMLADKIRCQLRELRPGGDGRGGLYSARFGIAEWSKGDDARGLLKKASVALTDQVSSMV
ncbi:MAG: GGDEF domain-containing protein [Gammaproteobacteria bacterium]|nr:GGDEF domain-containing protein [Gammaproteobacteria bacterium]